MIVSHSNRFIFVKPMRVGGTSFEAAISQFCDAEEDLVWTDEERMHLSAAEARNQVTKEQWEDYTKITIIRNPWDMMASYYFFCQEVMAKENGLFCPAYFDVFLLWQLRGSMPASRCHWILDGDLWADVHIRFENFDAACRDVWLKLGIPFFSLPRLREGRKPDGLHYSMMYGEQSMKVIQETYAFEIEKFGYIFEHVYKNGNNLNWIPYAAD